MTDDQPIEKIILVSYIFLQPADPKKQLKSNTKSANCRPTIRQFAHSDCRWDQCNLSLRKQLIKFMDFILSICDDTIMYMQFCHDFLGNIGVIALWLSECQWFFLS